MQITYCDLCGDETKNKENVRLLLDGADVPSGIADVCGQCILTTNIKTMLAKLSEKLGAVANGISILLDKIDDET